MLMIALEAAALGLYHASTGRGVALVDAWPNLASGLLLMGACRAALLGESTAVPAWLAGALLAHAFDLGRRWRR